MLKRMITDGEKEIRRWKPVKDNTYRMTFTDLPPDIEFVVARLNKTAFRLHARHHSGWEQYGDVVDLAELIENIQRYPEGLE